MPNIPHRTHLGFLVELAQPVGPDDKDLLAGRYVDLNDEPLGDIVLEDRSPVRRFLLIVSDDVPAMHAEAALENDHRTTARARRAVLRYPTGTAVPAGVVRDGVAWPAGDYVAYTFGSEEEAASAQGA